EKHEGRANHPGGKRRGRVSREQRSDRFQHVELQEHRAEGEGGDREEELGLLLKRLLPLVLAFEKALTVAQASLFECLRRDRDRIASSRSVPGLDRGTGFAHVVVLAVGLRPSLPGWSPPCNALAARGRYGSSLRADHPHQ